MEHLPIIIVHCGNSFYLEPILRQNRYFNPDNRICLISDKSTSRIAHAEHFLIDDYMSSAKEFQKIYRHYSVNTVAFELFCFQRWFCVLDFIKEQKMEHFVCIDSDYLLYESIDNIMRPYLSYDMTLLGTSGAMCALFSRESLQRFCDFCTQLYTEEKYLTLIREMYEEIKNVKKIGAISDMTAVELYRRYVSDNVVDIAVPRHKLCMDLRLWSPIGFETESRTDLMGRAPKKIYWRNNCPYGKFLTPTPEADSEGLVRFGGLHLQGGSKRMLPRLLLNKKGELRYNRWTIIRWYLRPAVFTQVFCKALRWYLTPRVIRHRILGKKKR